MDTEEKTPHPLKLIEQHLKAVHRLVEAHDLNLIAVAVWAMETRPELRGYQITANCDEHLAHDFGHTLKEMLSNEGSPIGSVFSGLMCSGVSIVDGNAMIASDASSTTKH